MIKRLLIYFIMFTLHASCSQGFGQELSLAAQMKVDSLFSSFDKTDAPGVAVVITQNGKVLLSKGYGMANLEHKVPITPSTVFDVASVAKQFTGMAISMLIEQGKISLEDDVRKYIPELPDFGHTITVKHLLHHTSGIRDWTGTLSLAGMNLNTGEVITTDRVLSMVFNQKDLNFIPGTEHCYSNTGYNLLAELVERVSGESFSQWTKRNIFEPLEMKNTHFRDDFTEIIPNKANGYFRWTDGQFHVSTNNLTAVGSSALYTTINDLAKWLINFENHKVGGTSVIRRMLQPGQLKSGEQTTYGFGIGVDNYRGEKRIGHSGGWSSFSSYLGHFPDQNLSVAVLSNTNLDTYELTQAIVDMFLPEKEELESQSNRSKNKEITLPVSALDQYLGMYRLGPGWYVKISRNNENLMAQATNEDAVPMTAISQTTFWVDAYGASIDFIRDSIGEVKGFNYRGKECPKVDNTIEYSQKQLVDYTGTYVSEELNTCYTVNIKEDQLVLNHKNHGTINLKNIWNEEFSGNRWFMNTVEFYRDKNGKVAGFLVSDNRSRNQRFIRTTFAE